MSSLATALTKRRKQLANSDWMGMAPSARNRLIPLSLAVAALAVSTDLRAADADAAQDLAKASGCFKCHAVDKKKDGRPYRDVAAKFAGIADAEQKLIFHITSGEKVKFPDGHEEDHKKVKSKDQKEIRNLVQWILSLPGGKKY